jgi:hypothetical protein
VEAGLPNFWEQKDATGLPAAGLPFTEIAADRPQSPRRSALAGYMADHFGCQHPKMTKPTKIEAPILPAFEAFRSAGSRPRRSAC